MAWCPSKVNIASTRGRSGVEVRVDVEYPGERVLVDSPWIRGRFEVEMTRGRSIVEPVLIRGCVGVSVGGRSGDFGVGLHLGYLDRVDSGSL